MTDIHVVTKHNACKYSDVLEEFYRLRHDIFVGERRWEALRRPDGREIDAFDDEEAVYLLALEDRRVVGGQRLYPTTRPHMISTSFGALATRPVAGPDVLEWTRYFVVRERRFGRTDGRLLAAVQDYCLTVGVTTLTAVVEMWWLPRWHHVGFKTRPLGLPQMIEGQPTIAVAIDVSEESLRSVRHACGLNEGARVRRPSVGGSYAA